MTQTIESREAGLTRPANWIAWAAAGILLTLALGPLARFVSTSAAWLDYPYPRAGSEGLILYESLLMKHGGDIYAPITPDRFISGPYPPLFYWLAAAILPDTLPDFSTPDAVDSIFVPGRIVSLVSAIVTALLLPLLIFFQQGAVAVGRRTVAAALVGGLLAGAIFLSLPQVTVWATRFRGDMLMIALTTAGLTCVAIGSSPQGDWKRGSWAWLLAGAAFFSLAFYTKQTALAGPIASALFLVIRDWRAGLKWCIAMGTLVLVPFVLLELATQHWFYLKMVTYHSLPLRSLTLSRLLEFAFWEDEWPLILLAAVQAAFVLAVAARAWRQKHTNKPPLLLPLFTLAALGTLPTGAVVGADHNHLLMSGLAIAAGTGALVAYLIGRLTEASHRGTLTWAAGAATAILLAVYILFTSEPSSWYNPDLVKPSVEQQEQLRKIVYNISQNPGTLFFSDDPGFLALAGKETPYDDPFTMAALAPLNRWDETAFRNRLAGGKFSLLLLSCDVTAPNTCRADTFTPGVLDAIRSGYKVLFRDVMFTYAPR
ncbi:MAG: hypothetical protein ABI670_05445 [Chloroflexota bacterium]